MLGRGAQEESGTKVTNKGYSFSSPRLEFHPLADVFPLMEGAEFDALVSDVRTNGILEPVELFDGKILDGRNRYLASLEAEVHCPRQQFNGNDPLSHVISLNLRRRHLDESQRAMVAAKIARLSHGQRQSGQLADVPTQDEAATILNVGERSVRRAREVIDQGAPALVQSVERGAVSVSAAAEVARLPVEQQQEIVEQGPKAVQQAAKDIRETGHVRGTFGTGDNQWFTPVDHLERARRVLGAFDLDPASHELAQKNVQATNYFVESDNGLEQEWKGRIWLNPPYAQPAIENFIDKLIAERKAGRVTDAIALTHNYTDTAWFQKAARAATAICFTRGRVRFVAPDGTLASPTQGQAFFYFGQNIDAFALEFSSIGFVAEVRA